MTQADPHPVDGPPAPCPYCQQLHSPEVLAAVEYIERMYGRLVKIQTDDGIWMIPRGYVALHGLSARELPLLAALYGWQGELRG